MIKSNNSCVKYHDSPRALHVDGGWLSTMLFEILLGFKCYCIRFRKILQLPSGCFKGILPPWSPPDEEAKLSQFVPEVQKARRIRGMSWTPTLKPFRDETLDGLKLVDLLFWGVTRFEIHTWPIFCGFLYRDSAVPADVGNALRRVQFATPKMKLWRARGSKFPLTLEDTGNLFRGAFKGA